MKHAHFDGQNPLIDSIRGPRGGKAGGDVQHSGYQVGPNEQIEVLRVGGQNESFDMGHGALFLLVYPLLIPPVEEDKHRENNDANDAQDEAARLGKQEIHEMNFRPIDLEIAGLHPTRLALMQRVDYEEREEYRDSTVLVDKGMVQVDKTAIPLIPQSANRCAPVIQSPTAGSWCPLRSIGGPDPRC
jgi:hypothetical protein